MQRSDGRLVLGFAQKSGRNAITNLVQHAPARALFPAVAPGAPLETVLVNVSGGLAGGDTLAVEIELGPDAAVVAATQAAEKVYRSLAADSVVSTTLHAAAGAWLEWLPQPTILFDGARLRRRLDANLAPDARLLAVETILFGRAARGERLTHGLLHDVWAIRRDGALAWADAVRLDGDIAAARARPFGFGAAAGYANVIYAGPDAADFLDLARALVRAAPAAGAATLVGGILLIRLLDVDGARLHAAAGHIIKDMRAAIAGLPAELPKVWQC